MRNAYMERIRAIQAKVRAFVPLTADEMKTIRAYANAKVDELITEHKSRSHARVPRKTAAQLDREIASALAAGPSVTISVHADDETGDETFTISDDGGEFDDIELTNVPDVQGDIDDRRAHYRAMGRRVVLDAPARMDWR